MRLLLVSEGGSELGGALEGLLRRLLPLELIAKGMKISHPDLRADHGKGARYFKKAIRCARYAEKCGFDAVVVVIDQDDQVNRRKQLADAQDDQSTFFPRAFGVAVRTFDAWMLADEKALTSVLGITIRKQPNPEDMRDPKAVCNKLREKAAFNEDLSEFYSRVASQIDIATLEDRCPLGFRPFVVRARQLVTPA